MTPRLRRSIVLLLLCLPAVAQAQVPGYSSKQFRMEQLDVNHWRLTGQVELENAEVKGQKFYATSVDIHTDTHLLEATGNVSTNHAHRRTVSTRRPALHLSRVGMAARERADGVGA
jgi:hypothetical protein